MTTKSKWVPAPHRTAAVTKTLDALWEECTVQQDAKELELTQSAEAFEAARLVYDAASARLDKAFLAESTWIRNLSSAGVSEEIHLQTKISFMRGLIHRCPSESVTRVFLMDHLRQLEGKK